MNYYVLCTILLLSIQISYGSTYDEQVLILRKLKELFITDFNSFLNYAIDTVNLDCLEMEIPLELLKYLTMSPLANSDAPKISIERLYGKRGQNSYSIFTTDGKSTKDSYKYTTDDVPYLTTVNNIIRFSKFFTQKKINLGPWETIKFKMFFQKDFNHQIFIFERFYPFSCFEMLFRIHSYFGLPTQLSAQGYYSDVEQKFIYNIRPLSMDNVTYILDVWENNGVIFNFQSSKTLFYFPSVFEEQYEDEVYLSESEYYLNNIVDPNAYLYLNYWQNVNYLHSKSEEYDAFEDSPFFEENIFKNEENSSVEETISDRSNNANLVKTLNSSPQISCPWLCFLLTDSLPFENQVLEISNTEFVNPYLKNSSPEANNQNSFFQENNFDN